jgi:hypothetical protein
VKCSSCSGVMVSKALFTSSYWQCEQCEGKPKEEPKKEPKPTFANVTASPLAKALYDSWKASFTPPKPTPYVPKPTGGLDSAVALREKASLAKWLPLQPSDAFRGIDRTQTPAGLIQAAVELKRLEDGGGCSEDSCDEDCDGSCWACD